MRSVLFRNFWKQLIAVVAGNLIYFFALMPILPLAARHNPEHIDLGLIIDFWVCLVCYGIVELWSRSRRRESDNC